MGFITISVQNETNQIMWFFLYFLQSFAFVALALIASVSCSKQYDNHHGNYDNLAKLAISSSASSSAAAPASVYSAPSYALGQDHHAAGHSVHYAARAPAARAYAANKHAHAAPKYSVQQAYATELYPGQHNYQTYHSAPTYSQVALPIVPSAPVAKLYVPPQHSYGAQSYGSPAGSYSGY